MNDRNMRERIDEVLARMDAAEVEQRIAPVKCEKNPEAPECQAEPLYGIYPEYGVEPMYGVDNP
jgi:hypothetical protein